ncbi:hypothetical protein C5167_019503 [Papaver somniferum]|uniref:Glycosyltransferase n=1 Tax=Papaver somniferum TaxID=3469 RepID=A0A4Y7ITM6_PAPSO|nr:UDP-glycosyltransferase 74F2-like [Papaver somniferum]RZC51081.1 hypothetical protein C5167_019503 [Papaver somniferum]
MEKIIMENRGHVLMIPYPAQGHINPCLQFLKRLVSKGLKTTLVTTKFLSKSINKPNLGHNIGLEFISDGFDNGGFAESDSIESYLQRLQTVGSADLTQRIKKLNSSPEVQNPVNCIIYDAFLPWALDVARQFGLVGGSFFTQPCAVNNIYYQFGKGLLKIDDSAVTNNINVKIPGLPIPLQVSDLPSFLCVPGAYPSYLELALNQFVNVGKADWIFINSFDMLEVQVVDWMTKTFSQLRTIGPTIPSMYLDKRIEDDNDYGLNLIKPDSSICINWLNSKANGTVVYVSFGSMAELSKEQMEELAMGLIGSNFYFLWVVRGSEAHKLSGKFLSEIENGNKGLVVKWSPQLEVLSHAAVGCFVTHCGWNSTLEALSLGVPMVGIPQWTDQTTNAKFIADEWRVGIRVKVNDDEKGIWTRKDLEVSIREVMEGDRGKEMKKNSSKWRQLAQQAVGIGGSSDRNLDEFVANLIC